MKNKLTMLLFTLILINSGYICIGQETQSKDKKYQVDLERSILKWKGKKLIGYSHDGILKLSKAELVLEGSTVKKGFVEINMHSLIDHNAMENPNETDLTDHLKSEDFFHVKKYPTSSIKITGAQPVKDNPDAGDRNYILTGDLTIKGITKKIGFPASISADGGLFKMKATIVFDRSKWNIRYGSGSFFDNLGDEMISDDIEVQVLVIANAI